MVNADSSTTTHVANAYKGFFQKCDGGRVRKRNSMMDNLTAPREVG